MSVGTDDWTQAPLIALGETSSPTPALPLAYDSNEPYWSFWNEPIPHGAYWKFEPQESGWVTVDTEQTQGSGPDTMLAVWAGKSRTSFYEVAVDDDGGAAGYTSKVTFYAHAGYRYYFEVASYADPAADVAYVLNVQPGATPPANWRVGEVDVGPGGLDPASAVPITGNSSAYFSNADYGAGASAGPERPGYTFRRAWYVVTPPHDGLMKVWVYGNPGYYLYDAGMTVINADLDTGASASMGFVPVTAGTTYYLMIASPSDVVTNYSIQVGFLGADSVEVGPSAVTRSPGGDYTLGGGDPGSILARGGDYFTLYGYNSAAGYPPPPYGYPLEVTMPGQPLDDREVLDIQLLFRCQALAGPNSVATPAFMWSDAVYGSTATYSAYILNPGAPVRDYFVSARNFNGVLAISPAMVESGNYGWPSEVGMPNHEPEFQIALDYFAVRVWQYVPIPPDPPPEGLIDGPIYVYPALNGGLKRVDRAFI